MASSIPVANVYGVQEKKSKSKRLGALLDLSRGEPPLTVARRNIQKEPQKNTSLASAGSQSRAPTSRIPQSPSSHKQPTQSEFRGSRPTLAHGTQPSSANSRSGIPMVKPTAAVGGYIEPSKQPVRVLRRKQSTILKEPSNVRAPNPSRSDSGITGLSPPTKNPRALYDPISPLSDRGITHISREARTTPQSEVHPPKTQPTQIYPELDRYRDVAVPSNRDPLGRDALYRLATEDLPPPTPLFSGASSHSQLSSFSASPSTRFSGSPGPGPYSRDTTPTSICSQSPGIVAPVRLPAGRVRQASPAETRPPITRRRAGSTSNEGGSFSADPQGLAAVREALTSSSSNSTVRAEEKTSSKVRRGHVPTPPSPPPRKSSQSFKKGRSTDETQSSFHSRISSHPGIMPPSPGKFIGSAHNRVPSATQSHQRRPTPPSRPSRDGTPDLYSQFGGPVPIIHSNLSSTSLTERSSQDRPGSARPSLSREPSAPQIETISGSQANKNDPGKTIRAPSPSVSTFKYKFPLFGRRTKAGPDERKRDKIPRKGPAAGTGHEGYGRVGAVKRRSSIGSALQRGLPGPISSSESLASALSTDQFLLERMSPVIIAGGEVVENQNTSSDLLRTESNQSASWRRPSLGPRNLSATSPGAREANRQTLWPSPSISEAIHSQRPSNDGDSEGIMMKPALVNRRSTRELQRQDNERVDSRKAADARAPSVVSMATTIYTDDSCPDVQTERSRITQASSPAKKLTKRAKSPRKWNLFGRSQASSHPKTQAESSTPAWVEPSLDESLAFYKMVDSSKQGRTDDKEDINAMSRRVEALPTLDVQFNFDRRPSTSSGTSQVSPTHIGKDMAGIRSKPSDLVPQIWQLDTKQEYRQIGRKTVESSPNRPSRLPQVGRIPKVVASRPEQTSPKSFSRPFNRVSAQLLPVHLGRPDEESIAKGPSPPDSVASRTTYAESSVKSVSQESFNKEQTLYDGSPIPKQQDQEFLVFPPYNNSGGAEGSESSCSDTPGYAAHTAQIPEPSAPLGEDEVWDEFNDLLEGSPPSPTSSCGVPFPLETYHSNLAAESTKPLESPTFTTKPAQDVRLSVASEKTVTTSSHHSADMTARINAAFRFDSEPAAVSEAVSGHGDLDTSGEDRNQESKMALRTSSSSNEGDEAKIDSERGSQASNRGSGSSRLSEETPLSQVNLRVGSMTVSKWLTFGHVLFSPVREDLINHDSSLKRQSILVIDGLGNDDWSFYAAETYPAANFFNLSPRAPLPKEHQTTSSFPISPSNHHQIQFTSHADKFPFGPDSFTALVFRFPAVAPEAHYRNIISEAQRVLKPGGFIEFSVLDVDLNNVGGRTRRAVRHLKEKVSTQNPDLYLSSTADLILRLLGRKGFVDIKTCRVGVPVASSITNTPKTDRKKDERSLAEMMNDNTEIGDKNITKMVSKVGRWWYNRCYETPTGMSSSIWHDQALLAECEEWATSLKLMVCHARVPESRGRLASI